MGKIVNAVATVHAPQLFTRPPSEIPEQLDADIAATFTFGYTFNSQNAFLFSYRGFGTEGRPEFDNTLIDDMRTRLDMRQLWQKLPSRSSNHFLSGWLNPQL